MCVYIISKVQNNTLHTSNTSREKCADFSTNIMHEDLI